MKIQKTALLFGLVLTMAGTAACGLQETVSTNTADEEISAAVSTNKSVSVGYIILSEDQKSADLVSAPDSTDVLAKMFQDDPITVYAIEGEWASVGYGGTQGYVRLENVSFTEPVESVETTTPEAAVTEAVEKVTEKKDTEKSGGDVTINLVFFDDGDGFRVAKPVSYTSYVEESVARNAWCSAESIYIYAQPDTSSPKREANMLYYGDSLTILGTVEDWYYISTDSGNGYDLHGYVKQSYITYGESPAAPENASATHGVVSVGSANVRSSPNKETNDNVLFTLYQGDEFDVLSYDGYWYEIMYNGTICYISHKMVEVW